MRMVIDYKKLSKKTIADKYPIPDCNVILSNLEKTKVFSTIDLKSGFHQILMKPEDFVPLDVSGETLSNDDEVEEIPSTSSSAKKRKRNNDENFLEIAKKEQKIMEEYLNKSNKNEEKDIDSMEQTNTIPLAILNKNT
nr:uncharacterized protein LOC106625164 [Bactrocera oleae]